MQAAIVRDALLELFLRSIRFQQESRSHLIAARNLHGSMFEHANQE